MNTITAKEYKTLRAYLALTSSEDLVLWYCRYCDGCKYRIQIISKTTGKSKGCLDSLHIPEEFLEEI